MALGLGRVGVVIALAALGCARAAPLASPAAVSTPALVPNGSPSGAGVLPVASAAPSPAPPGAVEVRVQGDAVWVAQASYGGDELVAQLSAGRGSVQVLSVRVAPEASDLALAEVLEAAPKAGFEQVWLERAGETLTIATTSGDDRARVIAWRNGDRIVGYDMRAPEGTSGILGPFELVSEEGRKVLRAQLAKACQDPCRAELDVVPEASPHIWQTLSAWQQSAGSVTTVATRVLAIVPRPSSNKPAASAAPPGAAPPKVKLGATTVSGRIPPRVIQHVVRSSFEKFRTCYEEGLGRNSSLEGRVSIRFVIDRTGKVSNVVDGGSDIPDAEVVSCVLKAMSTVEFPAPANGIVTVVYPIMFAPG